jgi:hypothetical protein
MYSDEDRLSEEQFLPAYFKPTWDPVMFMNNCYIAHLCAIDRERALELGAYTDPDACGCHDWETFIRFKLADHQPVHVPEIVYSWRMHPGSCAGDVYAKSYIHSSHRKVLDRFLKAQAHPERYWVGINPFCSKNALNWWFRRKRVAPRPLFTAILADDPAKVNVDVLIHSLGYPEHTGQAIAVKNGLDDLYRIAVEQEKRGALVHLAYEAIDIYGDDWPWEVLCTPTWRWSADWCSTRPTSS